MDLFFNGINANVRPVLEPRLKYSRESLIILFTLKITSLDLLLSAFLRHIVVF